MKKIFLASLFFIITSCSSMPADHENPGYSSLLSTYTDRAQYYEGFQNIFQYKATLLNEKILRAQYDIKSSSYKWTDDQRAKENAKLEESLKSESLVFFSFYTVDYKLNDMTKKQTIWRVFLDVNNKRYAGVIQKSLDQFNEMMIFYPYYDRFSSAYYVKFAVPMANIQNYPSKLTVTGTVGSKSIEFPAMK